MHSKKDHSSTKYYFVYYQLNTNETSLKKYADKIKGKKRTSTWKKIDAYSGTNNAFLGEMYRKNRYTKKYSVC